MIYLFLYLLITKPHIALSKRAICHWPLTHTFFSSCHTLTHTHFHRSHKQVQLQIIHLSPTFWLTHYRQYLTEYLSDVAETWFVHSINIDWNVFLIFLILHYATSDQKYIIQNIVVAIILRCKLYSATNTCLQSKSR